MSDKLFVFYTRCKACDAPLNRRSIGVKEGIQESPYCSRCSSLAFDTSEEHEYEQGYLTDIDLFSSIDTND